MRRIGIAILLILALGTIGATGQQQVVYTSTVPITPTLPTNCTHGINFDGTLMTCAAAEGTVTSVATTSPITGGTITTTGTLACATCVTSAAVLANGGLVLGTAGTQASATNTQLTFSAPTLTVGLAGTSSGILALTGSTSGSATFTAPAVAGTRTNAVISTNELQLGVAGTNSGILGLAGSTSGVATFTAPAVAGTSTNAITSTNNLSAPALVSTVSTGTAPLTITSTTAVANLKVQNLSAVSGGDLPSAAGGTDVGSTALPYGNAWLGTAATNNFKFQPATTSGARIITMADPLSPTTVALPMTIANGTSAMTTAGIATGACGTTVTTAATGVLTTDTIDVSHNAAPTNGNGGNLILNWWPTSGNVNFNYCNPSAGTVTPTAMTVNWSVRRP